MFNRFGYNERDAIEEAIVESTKAASLTSRTGQGRAREWQRQQQYDRTFPHAAGRPTSYNAYCTTPSRRRYKCNVCGEAYFNVDDLQVHTLTTHREEEQNTQGPPPYAGAFRFDVVPVNLELAIAMTGEYRGIQGENNSCYLDSSLMAMFYANDTFDDLLVGATCTNANKLDANQEYARTYMTMHLINHVRQRAFVPSGAVVEWRRMINGWFGRGVDFDSHCQEEEACDFVRFLLESLGNDSVTFVVEPANEKGGVRSTCCNSDYEVSVDSQVTAVPSVTDAVVPSNHSSSANREVMLQLLVPSHMNQPRHGVAWTMDHLLHDTLRTQDLVFSEVGKSLILQLPRYGKRDRVIGDVVPDPTLHVRTKDQASGRCKKVMYELRAVLVIGSSHFVSYLRVPEPKGSKRSTTAARATGRAEEYQSRYSGYRWLYFDSMSNRVGDQNVPLILDVTDELQVLETQNASALVGHEMWAQPGRNQHLKRVVQDMSMAFYGRVASQELECSNAPPDNFAIHDREFAA